MAPPSMITTSTTLGPTLFFPNSTIDEMSSENPIIVEAVRPSSETPLLGNTSNEDLLHKNDSSVEDINNEAK